MELQIKRTIAAGKRLFDSADINIPEKEMTVIVGKNGTGKTILLRRLFDAYKETGRYPMFVEQENEYIFTHVNILGNICLSNEKEEQEIAHEFLGRYALQDLETRNPDTLSGGEKRIISIMRAVYFADVADVILLDEPSNDLDYRKVNMLKNLLIELKRKCTIIIVTHDDRLSSISDHYITIEDRKIRIQSSEKKVEAETLQDTGIEPEDYELITVSEEHKAGISKVFMNRILSFGNFLALFALILCAVAVFCTAVTLDDSAPEEQVYVSNEVDFIHPVSNYGGYALVTDAIPVAMLRLFDDDLTSMEKLSTYEELADVSMPVNYGMELKGGNGTDYSVIELEYYDPLTGEYYYPIDLYKELYGIESDMDIDTTEYFYLEEIFGDSGRYRLDLEQYYLCRDQLLSNYEGVSLECTYMVVLLSEQMTFSDFIDLTEVKKLTNGNFYIRSKETGDLLSQMKTLQAQVQSITLSSALSILILAIYFFVVVIALHIKRKAIVSLCDMNIGRKQVVGILKKNAGMNNFAVAMAILTISVCFGILWQREASEYVANYLSVFVLVIAMYLMKRGSSIIISIYTKHIWSWRRR